MIRRLPIVVAVIAVFVAGHLTGRRAVLCEITGHDPYDFTGPAYVLHVPASMGESPKEPHRVLEVYAYVIDGKRVDVAAAPADQTEIWQIVIANNRIMVFGVEKKPDW